jgi:hypothetical protein
VKSVPMPRTVSENLLELLSHLRCLRGLMFSLKLGTGSVRRMLYHLAYFAEAILSGRYMRRRGLSHLHASVSATVLLITTRAFPVTVSFGVYGYGEFIILPRHRLRSGRHSDSFDGSHGHAESCAAPASPGYPN